MFIQTLNQIKSSDEQKFYYFSKQHHAHAEAAIEMYFEKPIFGVGPKISEKYVQIRFILQNLLAHRIHTTHFCNY